MMNKEDNLKEQFIKTNEIEKGIVESAGDTRERHAKKYGRESLMKLRLHPLALQKPKELPNIDIIKSKAHFQHISEDLGRANIQHVLSHALSSGWLPPIMRSDGLRRMLSHSPSTPALLNRVYPYHSSSRLHKKHPMSPAFSNCGQSFATPIHVPQHTQNSQYPPTTLENIWNCYRGYSPAQEQPRKDCRASIPRSKKMIEIIDPDTGKNVLEIASPTTPKETRSTHLDASTSSPEQEQKDETRFENEKPEENCCIVETNDLKTKSRRNLGNGDANESTITNTSCVLELCESLHGQCSADSNCSPIVPITSTGDDHKHPFPKLCKCKKAEQVLKKECETVNSLEQPENNNTDNYAAVDVKESPDLTSTENAPPPCEDSDKDTSVKLRKQIERDAKLLRENILTLKREQQQIIMLKNIMLNKQRQMEETSCLLEDKKMEMADLELFLMSKERRLRRKEYVLGTRESMLQNVEKKQEEKEQQLRIMKAYLEHPEAVKKGVSKAQNTFSGTEDKTKCCAQCDKRLPEAENHNLEEKNNAVHCKMFCDLINTSEPEPFTNDKPNSLAFKEPDESLGTELSSKGFPNSNSMGRKYFPLDIQLWLEKKEKMLKDKECASQKESKLIKNEAKILGVEETSG